MEKRKQRKTKASLPSESEREPEIEQEHGRNIKSARNTAENLSRSEEDLGETSDAEGLARDFNQPPNETMSIKAENKESLKQRKQQLLDLSHDLLQVVQSLD